MTSSNMNSLAAALAIGSFASASSNATATSLLAAHLARGIATEGAYAAVIKPDNCNDSGPGSLRQAVVDAGEDGTVDLSTLSCSKITLTGTEIEVQQQYLTIHGPSQGITISANQQSRVFNHSGQGTLSLSNLTVQDGNYTTNTPYAQGGCIRTSGTASLLRTTITGCTATSPKFATGGGLFAIHGAILKYSNVSGNLASAAGSRAIGGGIDTGGTLVSASSTIEGNVAYSKNGHSYGGGISGGSVTSCYISNSLVNANSVLGNSLAWGGGISMYEGSSCTILNSTITNNKCLSTTCSGGGLYSGKLNLKILNSTIVSNSASRGGGIDVYLKPLQELNLQSSIIAKNSADKGFADVETSPVATVSGSTNDIMFSDKAIMGDRTDDPMLGPLHDNGGPTKTMLPMLGSPIIGQGSNPQHVRFDQRGPGHPRSSGALIDIGATQFDTIFSDGLDP